MAEWIEYDGSDEQLTELESCKHFLTRYKDGRECHWNSGVMHLPDRHKLLDEAIAYWIIPEDPLREMKIRQAMTGQPVWIKFHPCAMLSGRDLINCGNGIFKTTKPDWNIPNAEYSFTPFEYEAAEPAISKPVHPGINGYDG